MDILLNKQEYVVFLAAIMVSSGIIKDKNYFGVLFGLLVSHIKSKRLLVFLVSLVSGVLPVPGRVSVSAAVLDTLASQEPESRSKFGIIDYLATHHYYLWSPLEKTIILPMGVLGLSYVGVLSYTWPLLLVSLLYIGFFICTTIKEGDVTISYKGEESPKALVWTLLPLLLSVGLLVGGYEGWLIFLGLALYYMIMAKTWDIVKYLNWKLLMMVGGIILVSNFIGIYYEELRAYVGAENGVGWAAFLGFCASFALGSSGKFIGITVLLTQVFGLQYFTLFFALEYAAYLISPTHKCTCIGKMYFKTPFLTYAKVLGIWSLLMVAIGIIV
tara:strand:+ start:28 stop:1014 length:987 start_codon:yes stop_codon:yes gene_type:complete